jgi:hypothetical protein
LHASCDALSQRIKARNTFDYPGNRAVRRSGLLDMELAGLRCKPNLDEFVMELHDEPPPAYVDIGLVVREAGQYSN